MSYDYSENILVQKSAGDLLRDELGWDCSSLTIRNCSAKTARSGGQAITKYCCPGIFKMLCGGSTRG